ncbi:polysaccharide deacetylase family protein [Streptococcus iniae]|uniref:polysaccharide deacetylase family protein n=1 Tax=Streptococcus iniae TaxID=1346 RepID=UPI000EF77FC3|nr:polysaccharide deacetylase family protein [Streptococcus iniae]RLU33537.1 deacetylase [Streptococcus iniae]RLU48364.1 deacetylase [Streptococcus iniae]
MKKLNTIIFAIISVIFIIFWGITVNNWQINNQVKAIIKSEKKHTERYLSIKSVKSLENGDKTFHYFSPLANSDHFYQDNLPMSVYQKATNDKEDVFIEPIIEETPLKNVKTVTIHEVRYKHGLFQVNKASDQVVSRYHVNEAFEHVRLSQLFKEKEETVNQKLKDLSHGKWNHEHLDAMTEKKHILTDQFDIASNQLLLDDKISLPLSDLFDIVNPDLLEGDVKVAYDDYQKKKEEERQRDKKIVALTFDDGPNPVTTPQVLSILDKYHAKGTFFMLGSKISGNEDLVKKVKEAGHEIGNHSWDHPNLTKLSPDQVSFQIKNTNMAIEKVTGKAPIFFRPPYGATNANVQSIVALTQVLWTVDTRDWENHNTEAILANIKAQLRPGGIILMHDVHQTTVNALPTVLDYLKSQDYKFVTVSQVLGHS